MAALREGKTFTPTPDQQQIAALPREFSQPTPDLSHDMGLFYEPRKPAYEHDSRGPVEVKKSGWTYPNEHPEGILTKTCPVCGYKYGSEWRKEEVPAEVLAWLAARPDADHAPAWV